MSAIIPIDDPEDPRLADYRQVRERDLVGRDGGFIAEGVVVLEKLIRAGRHPLRSVLVAQKRAAALAPLLEELPPLLEPLELLMRPGFEHPVRTLACRTRNR